MTQHEAPTAKRLIRAAIAAAGAAPVVAPHLGVSVPAVYRWSDRGVIPAKHIKPLCDLGGNAIRPEQILDALTREASEKAAA